MEEQGLTDQQGGGSDDSKGRESPAMEDKCLIDDKQTSNVDINGVTSSSGSHSPKSNPSEFSQAIKPSRSVILFTNVDEARANNLIDFFTYQVVDKMSLMSAYRTQAYKLIGLFSKLIRLFSKLITEKSVEEKMWLMYEKSMKEVSYEVVKTMSLMSDLYKSVSYPRLNLESVKNLTHENKNYSAKKLQCYANGSEQDQRRKQRRKEMFRQCKTAASFRGKRKCYTIKQV